LGDRTRPLRWLYLKRFHLVALGMASLLGLGLLEVAIRVLDPLGISYYEETKRYRLEKIADPELIFAHRPNWSTEYESVAVSFNEFGFRDDPIQPRQPDEFRILLLGDSVAFGWGVEQDEIFATRLESILSEELGRPCVVINSGVGNYNTVQELAVLKRLGEVLAPDLLMLLYIHNDVMVHERPFDPHAQFDLEGRDLSGKLEILLGRSWLYRLIGHVRRTRPGRAPRARTQAPVVARSRGPRESMEALGQIADWSNEHEVPFVLYAWRHNNRPRDPLWGHLRRMGRVHGFPVEEVSPAWVPEAEYRLSAIDSHPNAAGHQLLAEGMARDLRERGLVPQPR